MPTHGSTLLERVVARFESAWQQGEQPAIEDYLQTTPILTRQIPSRLRIDERSFGKADADRLS